MNAIHISTAQAMMLRPDPVDLVVFKSDGSLLHYPSVISLKFDFYAGTRKNVIFEEKNTFFAFFSNLSKVIGHLFSNFAQNFKT